VSFYTETVRVGHTSITVRVVVEADRIIALGRQRAKVTEAEVIYVAVNSDRRPIPLVDPI
jgi:acyl-CoA thioesterase YciA